ncbi:Hypothetical protein NTJ_09065 [Nesidiocoris tenuis]|uniref:Uncharacterized protein n=1 Tax=Nesidiocoris tenuis TaxID=355587 RepID=A0ABN7AZD2_9HEMI|nr:Hypothetical protein NTJ_09065 [Nesidiocoris tenuis]
MPRVSTKRVETAAVLKGRRSAAAPRANTPGSPSVSSLKGWLITGDLSPNAARDQMHLKVPPPPPHRHPRVPVWRHCTRIFCLKTARCSAHCLLISTSDD